MRGKVEELMCHNLSQNRALRNAGRTVLVLLDESLPRKKIRIMQNKLKEGQKETTTVI